MRTRASVYVRQYGEIYKSCIKLVEENEENDVSWPLLELNCELTPQTHRLIVTAGNETLHPDDETYGLLEHLTLFGATKIRTEMVDAIIESCGGRVCADTDVGILYNQRQIPGQVEIKVMYVPNYLQNLIAARRRRT